MVDYVKILILKPYLITRIWNNRLLSYKSEKNFLNRETGEIKTHKIKFYKNMDFILFDNKLEIRGSLHYFFNNGHHNFNDFKVEDCINIIYHLQDLFQIDLAQCRIINLEFGINMQLDISVERVVEALFYHERNMFRHDSRIRYLTQSSSFNRSLRLNTYKIIKCYAKNLQFTDRYDNVPNNVFRFEIKSCQSKYINSIGVYTLQDLTSPKPYLFFADILKKEWNKVLLLDINGEYVNDEKISKYLNPNFWNTILKNKSRNTFTNNKNKFHRLLEEHHPNNMQAIIRKKMEEKLFAISKTSPKNFIVQFPQVV